MSEAKRKTRARNKKSLPAVTTKIDHLSEGELADTLKHVKKRYGINTIGKARNVWQPDRISTGSFIMDFSLLGGIPHNRVTMILGKRSAGKSTLASKVVASAQKQYPDQVAVYIDLEGTVEPVWMEHLGVDVDALEVASCETGEMAVDIADAVVRSKETSIVVVDSLAALTPMKEIDDSAEDAHVGIQAKLVTRMLRKITSGLIAERKKGHYVTVVNINQYRAKIGGFGGFGEQLSVPGGHLAEFAPTVQLVMKNKENKGKDVIGIDTVESNTHPFTILKNKMNSGPRAGEFKLVRTYDETTGLNTGDIDNVPTILLYAKKFGKYSGGAASWKLEFGDYRLKFKKAQQALDALYEDIDMQHALWVDLIRSQAKSLGMPSEFIERIRGGWGSNE